MANFHHFFSKPLTQKGKLFADFSRFYPLIQVQIAQSGKIAFSEHDQKDSIAASFRSPPALLKPELG
jgi:hypothetical protein